MSLGLALSNAVSGLRLNQQALSVLSNNMANVNTEGYSRKVIEQSAIYIEGQGNGVRIDDIVRKVDTYLQRSVMNQGSQVNATQTVSSYYDRLQVLLGAPGAENSIDEYMSTFFNSMQQMADQPDRTSYRSNMVNSANILAEQVSGLAYEMESLRFQADSDLSGAITEVNAALRKLYDLNIAIARSSALGQSTAGLLDERDSALKVLANNMNITTFYEPNGTVAVTGGDGAALVDGILHQLRYSPVASVDNLVDNQRINPIEVISIDSNGQETGIPTTLISGGLLGEVQNSLSSGKMYALAELRDDLIPDILNQLDMLASRLRDSMNGLHNNGSGWPPAQSLTGTREVYPAQQTEWLGSVRIAVLRADGTPVPSGYADEAYTGIRPLTLDLGNLRGYLQPAGSVSMQTMIDEINAHFGAPTNKTELGNMNNIRLVSNTPKLPSAGALFDFDLELENISSGNASLFVTGIAVRDSTATALTGAVSRDVATIALDPTNTYTTFAGESYVDVGLASVEGLVVGSKIFLGTPGIPDANGISDLSGYFTINEINGNTVRITTSQVATASSTVNDVSGVEARSAYATIQPGDKDRTFDISAMQVDFSTAPTSPYYDITLDLGVVDAAGEVSTSQITYRIYNNRENLDNDRYSAISATGQATIELPTTSQASLRAILVDAEGNELPKVDGKYLDRVGFLKIVGGDEDYVIAIDEMDSQQVRDVTLGTLEAGTNWGFSHYFGLNDFFVANSPNKTGETLKNSAINLAVQQRIRDNPNLVSSGKLVQSAQTPGSNNPPQYTYIRYSGDNSAAQAMASLSSIPLDFAAAGGLPDTELSLQSYTSEMLGYLASLSSGAKDEATNAQILFDGFDARNKAQSAVNLDEELANTIVFQNSYAASARIITVINEMFKSLVDTV